MITLDRHVCDPFRLYLLVLSQLQDEAADIIRHTHSSLAWYFRVDTKDSNCFCPVVDILRNLLAVNNAYTPLQKG